MNKILLLALFSAAILLTACSKPAYDEVLIQGDASTPLPDVVRMSRLFDSVDVVSSSVEEFSVKGKTGFRYLFVVQPETVIFAPMDGSISVITQEGVRVITIENEEFIAVILTEGLYTYKSDRVSTTMPFAKSGNALPDKKGASVSAVFYHKGSGQSVPPGIMRDPQYKP
ncbi:hypothetical protein J4475_03640 [Candidatus Woesearchaeota archaeon]|nr:hypothetical protein [Candidatus Woesearchaeota archaeon]